MASTPKPSPSLPSRFWADLTTHDFSRLQASGQAQEVVAVLPVAAVEQHGPHLPLSVDATLADGLVAAALPLLPVDLPVLFLPTQSIGLSPEHAAFAGTLTLSPATLLALWGEIGACVARAGVRKLVLFNTHGGQVSAMDIVARQLRQAHGMMVWHSNWFNLPLPEAVQQLFDAREHRFGIHAGAIETSMMLALAPQQVRMAQARDFPSASETRAQQFPILGNGRSAKLGWAMQDYNPQGAAGNAAAATAEKGRALVDAAAAQLAQLLQEVARVPLAGVVEGAGLGAR